jgi:hypothetical protein
VGTGGGVMPAASVLACARSLDGSLVIGCDGCLGDSDVVVLAVVIVDEISNAGAATRAGAGTASAAGGGRFNVARNSSSTDIDRSRVLCGDHTSQPTQHITHKLTR